MKARRRLSKANTTTANDRKVEGTGSPDQGEPVFLVVGRLRRPHGLTGELQMDVLTDFPERLAPGKQIFIGDEHLPSRIEHLRPHDKLLLVSLTGCGNVDQARVFTNAMVYVEAHNLPELPEGEYYHHQLIGLSVIDVETGDILGRLEKILETGANDVYVVRRETGDEILLPAIESVVSEVNLDSKVMKVRQQQWW
jgi:16S rRNA processing protein RimM